MHAQVVTKPSLATSGQMTIRAFIYIQPGAPDVLVTSTALVFRLRKTKCFFPAYSSLNQEWEYSGGIVVNPFSARTEIRRQNLTSIDYKF